ncbi:hypothetical protein H490_0111310 [Leucobacter sp. UCD-THU]|uniref:hypothetical protein n=1 Tax=Leucobacter sp. UCD-THU TaxID=1292023 RepID=UPI0003682803|nr:hypothetical protein [Leucobacter sp. UCD-THU]EYT53069.1 hypothetical protein H490_0111310 [Leucobacter sp. UCD-THU]
MLAETGRDAFDLTGAHPLGRAQQHDGEHLAQRARDAQGVGAGARDEHAAVECDAECGGGLGAEGRAADHAAPGARR